MLHNYLHAYDYMKHSDFVIEYTQIHLPFLLFNSSFVRGISSEVDVLGKGSETITYK